MRTVLFFLGALVPLLISFPAMLSAQQTPNYDETKVPDYTLPDLLITAAGTPITTAAAWEEQRRLELLELFRREVYGSLPAGAIEWRTERVQVEPAMLDGRAVRKQVTLTLHRGADTVRLHLLLYLPAGERGPVPVFLGLNFLGNHTVHADAALPITDNYVLNKPEYCIFDHRADDRSRGVAAGRWPVEYVLSHGYGLATLHCGDVDPDYDDGFQNGVHALLRTGDQTERQADSAGTIAAWAFGLSRAMDYLETDPDVDGARVAVLGHSRLGKAALWAGAQDDRFSLVIANNSGCGGAALSRRRYGETVAHINRQFPHWFNANFSRYNDREDELPIDQHQLLALIAPRALYVASAEEDRWADPKGEYLALYHAGAAYRLYGLPDLRTPEPPAVNAPRWSGRLGYHIRSGAHDITRFDWDQYLNFAAAQWRE